MSKEDWKRIQSEDPMIWFWINCLSEGKCPDNKELPIERRQKHLAMRKTFDKLVCDNGILYRQDDR